MGAIVFLPFGLDGGGAIASRLSDSIKVSLSGATSGAGCLTHLSELLIPREN